MLAVQDTTVLDYTSHASKEGLGPVDTTGHTRGLMAHSVLMLGLDGQPLGTFGVNLWALTVTIIVENFTGAIGTVIFVAYLSALCNNPLHTATQYALLTALAAVGRTYLSAGAGFIAERTGWPLFFIISALTALPSLVLLVWLQQRGHFTGLAKPTRIVMDD